MSAVGHFVTDELLGTNMVGAQSTVEPGYDVSFIYEFMSSKNVITRHQYQ